MCYRRRQRVMIILCTAISKKNMQHKNWMNQSPPNTQFEYPPINKRNVIGLGIPNTNSPTEQLIDGAISGAPTVEFIAEPELNFRISSNADFPLSPGSVLKK